MRKKLVVLSGAGISAESGLKTFRDMGGLWENYTIEDVATPDAWQRNPQLVLDFYNQRRIQAFSALPNLGHMALKSLEEKFDVHIITQNVDNLHEKAGSLNVLHLHGELSKVRSCKNENLIYEIGAKAINIGDLAEDNFQLRPHIVWFGEEVPLLQKAAEICAVADYFLVVGTSLQVYPAASLLDYVPKNSPIFLVDINKPNFNFKRIGFTFINETAAVGLPNLAKQLLE